MKDTNVFCCQLKEKQDSNAAIFLGTFSSFQNIYFEEHDPDTREVHRTLSNIYDEIFFENKERLKANSYFHKRALS